MTPIIISSGVVSSGLRVLLGDEMDVLSGGKTVATVLYGGAEHVSSGGMASGTIVNSLGADYISGGAVAFGTVVAGGAEYVSSGGVTSGALVHAGGDGSVGEWILSGGLDQGSVIFGWETIYDGGVASGTIVSNGQQFDYGLTLGTAVDGGGETVYGVASGTVVGGGGGEVVYGRAVGTVVHGGGSEIVASGGVASGSVVGSGAGENVRGVLRVLYGGIASGATVQSGGTAFVAGVAKGTVLLRGLEYDYGVTSGSVLLSGGVETVYARARASGSAIRGGREVVHSGGMAIAATVSAGTLIVWSGGAIEGGLAILRGQAILSGTMAAGQTVTFAGSAGVLELDNLAGFNAKISGLTTSSQKIDIGGFAFSASESATWAQSGTSGTLTVTDGANVANLTLIGTYTNSSFNLSDDGHGGTFVVDPPGHAAPPAAAGFIQAMAALAGDFTADIGVHGGRTVMIAASPFVTAATSGR